MHSRRGVEGWWSHGFGPGPRSGRQTTVGDGIVTASETTHDLVKRPPSVLVCRGHASFTCLGFVLVQLSVRSWQSAQLSLPALTYTARHQIIVCRVERFACDLTWTGFLSSLDTMFHLFEYVVSKTHHCPASLGNVKT